MKSHQKICGINNEIWFFSHAGGFGFYLKICKLNFAKVLHVIQSVPIPQSHKQKLGITEKGTEVENLELENVALTHL